MDFLYGLIYIICNIINEKIKPENVSKFELILYNGINQFVNSTKDFKTLKNINQDKYLNSDIKVSKKIKFFNFFDKHHPLLKVDNKYID